MILVAALLSAQSPPPSVYVPQAAPATSAVVRSAEHNAIALQIVQICNSEGMTRRQLDRLVGDTLPAALAAMPEFVTIELKYPGFTQALVDAMSPEVVRLTIAKLPQLWERLMPVYADHFTTAELRELLAFYQSPTGQRLIEAIADNADFSRLTREAAAAAMRDKPVAVTAEALQDGIAPGIDAAIKTANPEDRASYLGLAQSSVGRKLAVVNPKIQAIAVDWGNTPDPEIDARMEKIVVEAMTAFIEKQEMAK